MGYKAYSDSYLMSLTKPQIIELLRTAEHNFFATEEALNNSAKTGMEIAEKFDKAKELLKIVVEDLNVTVAEVYNGGLVCECCKWKSQIDGCCCPDDGGCDVAYRWRYADEVEKLLNDEK